MNRSLGSFLLGCTVALVLICLCGFVLGTAKI